MALEKTKKFIKETKTASLLVIVVGIITLSGSAISAIFWIDDRYVDQEEVAQYFNTFATSINKNLTTINDNIILLGNSFYDQRITEIELLISKVDAIPNKNITELGFLRNLKLSLAEIKRKQQKLGTELESVGK